MWIRNERDFVELKKGSIRLKIQYIGVKADCENERGKNNRIDSGL